MYMAQIKLVPRSNGRLQTSPRMAMMQYKASVSSYMAISKLIALGVMYMNRAPYLGIHFDVERPEIIDVTVGECRRPFHPVCLRGRYYKLPVFLQSALCRWQ